MEVFCAVKIRSLLIYKIINPVSTVSLAAEIVLAACRELSALACFAARESRDPIHCRARPRQFSAVSAMFEDIDAVGRASSLMACSLDQ